LYHHLEVDWHWHWLPISDPNRGRSGIQEK